MMEAIRSSVTSVLTEATRRNVPENGILRGIVVFGSGRDVPSFSIAFLGSSDVLHIPPYKKSCRLFPFKFGTRVVKEIHDSVVCI
jgi:hypothetical protein